MHRRSDVNIQIDNHGCLLFEILEPIKSTFRYQSWDSGFQLQRLEDDLWEYETFDYGIPLLNLAEAEESVKSLRDFVEGIPKDIRTDVRPYVHCQSLMLLWLRKSNDAKQLFESSPNFFWLMVGFINNAYLDDEDIHSLLRQPRRLILARILGNESSAALKILNKVKLAQGDLAEYDAIVSSLKKAEQFRSLTKLNQIPVHILIAAAHYPWLADVPAFYTFRKGEQIPFKDFLRSLRHHVGFWNDALNVATLVHIPDAQIALRQCRDFDAVRRLHDRWTDRLNQEKVVAVEGKTRFPEPPLPAGEHIFPIQTFEDLQAEGRLMHHCVAGYFREIRDGNTYIYRVLQPERATVEIGVRGSDLSIRQIRLAYNRQPSTDTRSAVQAWFSNVDQA